MMNTTINSKILRRLCEPYYFVITRFQKFQLYFIMKSLAGAKIAFYCYSAQTIAAGLLKSNLGGSTNFLKSLPGNFLASFRKLISIVFLKNCDAFFGKSPRYFQDTLFKTTN